LPFFKIAHEGKFCEIEAIIQVEIRPARAQQIHLSFYLSGLGMGSGTSARGAGEDEGGGEDEGMAGGA